MNAYRLEHYYANKQQYYDRNNKTAAVLTYRIQRMRAEGICVDCGITYPDEPWMMEFDHLEGHEKISNVGLMKRCGSWKKIEAEVAKCDLLCLVCHRRRTANRGGWAVLGDPEMSAVEPSHGCNYHYSRGCRCDACVQWRRDYRAKLVDTRGFLLEGTAPW